jgi:hypothetical protein
MKQEKTQERHTKTKNPQDIKTSGRKEDRREHIYRIHKISRSVLSDA